MAREDGRLIPDEEVARLTHRELAGLEDQKWRMRADAYVKQVRRTSLGAAKRQNGPLAEQCHMLAVRQAIMEGKTVPPEVMAGYPGFAAMDRETLASNISVVRARGLGRAPARDDLSRKKARLSR